MSGKNFFRLVLALLLLVGAAALAPARASDASRLPDPPAAGGCWPLSPSRVLLAYQPAPGALQLALAAIAENDTVTLATVGFAYGTILEATPLDCGTLVVRYLDRNAQECLIAGALGGSSITWGAPARLGRPAGGEPGPLIPCDPTRLLLVTNIAPTPHSPPDCFIQIAKVQGCAITVGPSIKITGMNIQGGAALEPGKLLVYAAFDTPFTDSTPLGLGVGLVGEGTVQFGGWIIFGSGNPARIKMNYWKIERNKLLLAYGAPSGPQTLWAATAQGGTLRLGHPMSLAGETHILAAYPAALGQAVGQLFCDGRKGGGQVGSIGVQGMAITLGPVRKINGSAPTPMLTPLGALDARRLFCRAESAAGAAGGFCIACLERPAE